MPQTEKSHVAILKIGGSFATNDEGVNREYLTSFFTKLNQFLSEHFAHAVFVIGGGNPARAVQSELRAQGITDKNQLDEAGIAVTRKHAADMARVAEAQGIDIDYRVSHSPEELQSIISAAAQGSETAHFALALGGLMPGQSTDAVALEAAQMYAEEGFEPTIVILSNIAAILDKAPTKDRTAEEQTEGNAPLRAYREASVDALIEVGVLVDRFEPGMKTPIDSTAVRVFQQMLLENPELSILFTTGDNWRDLCSYLLDPRGYEPTLATKVVGNDTVSDLPFVEYHSQRVTREILQQFLREKITRKVS